MTGRYLEILEIAVRQGYALLDQSPLNAAEAGIKVLEDSPLFNAGYGSVLNAAGEVEMDAAICDGKTGRFGAVGALKNVANPISVARKVLEETNHVLLVGSGAETFARSKGFPMADCITKEMRHNWEQAIKSDPAVNSESLSLLTALPRGTLHAYDTVGCLVCDDGHLVAASSTGGSFLKLPGRIGDTPILGGGILAAEWGAVVCTGIGEAFIETMTASYVLQLLEAGITPQEAAEKAIHRLALKRSLPGGLIVLNKEGLYGAAYNTYSFPVAVMVNGAIVKEFRPVQK